MESYLCGPDRTYKVSERIKILTSGINGLATVIDEDAFFDFQHYRYDISDEQITEAYMEWFDNNGFPDANINPEGFIKRLA